MTAHQPHAHLEILRRCRLAQRQHPACRGAVHRDWLLHENVQPPFDGVGEMHPTKRHWRRQNNHVARAQTVHRLAVSLKPDEPTLRWHVDLVGIKPCYPTVSSPCRAMRRSVLQRLEAHLEAVLEEVGHGEESDRTVLRNQGIGHRAGAASAASDQCHPYGVVFGGVTRPRHGRHQCRPGNCPDRCAQKSTTRSRTWIRCGRRIHGQQCNEHWRLGDARMRSPPAPAHPASAGRLPMLHPIHGRSSTVDSIRSPFWDSQAPRSG